MAVTNAQVRKLMEELSKHGQLGIAALKTGMSRDTARKYRDLGKLPSELKEPRTWRTRKDRFEEAWPSIEQRLEEAPELEAKALFEHLLEERPDEYNPGQVRTFQRRVRQWRAEKGPPKMIFFPQEHRPGEAMQTDFTWAKSLGITINSEPFEHMLCHMVLPYSNWEWMNVCRSESMLALRRGVQSALFELGRKPEWHQTDNSTAATHDLRTGKRGFNVEYEALMRHFGMKPRTIGIGESHQNGDVEALNGAAKRRLKQHLLLRGGCDFSSVDEYESWVQAVMKRANGLRTKRFTEESAAMRILDVKRLPEYNEERVRVSSWSTINVKKNIYSVPSRLKGERVTVRLYSDRLDVYYGNVYQLSTERLMGESKHRIDYRHIIWSLVRKPGAFSRYRFRQDLFPSLTFRKTYDALVGQFGVRKGDIEYLRLLHLAASTMETDVEMALDLLLDQGTSPSSELVKELVSPEKPEIPKLAVFVPDLSEYDQLTGCGREVVQ